MSSVQAVLVSIPLVSAIVVCSRGQMPSAAVLPLVIGGLQFICLIAIAIGAAKMGFLESFQMGRLAGSLACIPFITPFIVVGIPFGIWSLRLLGDPQIQAAFQSVREPK